MAGQLRVVLVEPQEAGNVGAVSRAMKNFGFRELAVVGGMPDPLRPVAEWWASGADDLLDQATIYPSLSEAIDGAHLTVATTSARGRSLAPDLDPDRLAALFHQLGADETLALVFGREASGLSIREASSCQRSAVVPTWPEFPTMNLAQAVAVFCYALRRAQAEPVILRRPLPTQEALRHFHETARELLLEIGFLHENNPDRIYDDLRRLLGRALPDERELTILEGVLRQLRWKMRHRS